LDGHHHVAWLQAVHLHVWQPAGPLSRLPYKAAVAWHRQDGVHRVPTWSPTCVTLPTPSCPGTAGRGGVIGYLPWIVLMSLGFTGACGGGGAHAHAAMRATWIIDALHRPAPASPPASAPQSGCC
jgi:hypothetical protein